MDYWTFDGPLQDLPASTLDYWTPLELLTGGFSSLATAPTITSANHTAFAVGTLGTFAVTATGDTPITFSKTGSLPTGVTLASDGTLSGTPASGQAGTYAITITATNGVNPDATQSFTLTVTTALSAHCQRHLSESLANLGVCNEIATAVAAGSTSIGPEAKRYLATMLCDQGAAAELATAIAAAPAGTLSGRTRSLLAVALCNQDAAKELALAVTGS